ncbi:FAD-binding domain-containing protein [Trametes sanguinea]|nr:FAD-binding domain-containing protein [Trametes sanguinea]
MVGITVYLWPIASLYAWASYYLVGQPGDAARSRCLYRDSCWPTEDDFAHLSSKLTRPLIQPTTLAQPCYLPGSRSPANDSSGSCSIIAQHWDDGPGDPTMPAQCSIPTSRRNVPAIGVDARTVRDVQTAVQFAAQHDLRLVIKNTGHDFLGRSGGKGSFMIWTHRMKDISVHDALQPLGAPANEQYDHAITLGAGVQWEEAYAAADEADRMIVGGISAGGSVEAAGGWLLGGGHCALSPTYGLGENVLEISLVAANGAHITANAHRHPDILGRALRGGGGGTYGVVMSVTYRTCLMVPVKIAYVVATINSSQPTTGVSSDGSSLSHTFIALIPNVSWEQANATIVPYLGRVRALAQEPSVMGGQSEPLMKVTTNTAPYSSFYSVYKAILPTTGAAGRNLELGSWLLPRSLSLVTGGAVSRANPSSTGLNPAWRKTTVHVVVGTTWPDGTSPRDVERLGQGLERRTAEVRALARDSGTYFNEASMFGSDVLRTSFGAHRPELKVIKESYDPWDTFIVREGVRSEHWDVGFKLRCRLD